ncbi:hypothetical protein [Aeromonas veronii]|uniref:hypothetical protein n=1 Tax=Aeromonas veronii TaxID=654 RepID=UPI001BD16BC2|nr:hypothetical protein [Aeromonas veronii]MBS4702567.1 hypothetical protein [Aeromonas veronii]
MKFKINYYNALELFKNKKFNEIIDACKEELKLHPYDKNEIKLSDDEIKLLDITLRTCLMINDCESFNSIISEYGHLSALSHFSAANCFFMNDARKAWYFLSNASQYSSKHHGFWSLGLNSIVRNQNWFSYNDESIPSKLNAAFPEEHLTDTAFVFSSDAGYFNKYFEYSYNSLLKSNSDKLFIYHIINPDENTFAIIDRFKLDENVVFNYEYTGTDKIRKDYYASQRFFIAQEILMKRKMSVFIFDIDTIFLKNTNDLFSEEHWSEELLGIKISPNMELPWQKIAAGAIYIPQNDLGLSFINRVCAYIFMVNKNTSNENLWWIDQNALFFALIDIVKDVDIYQKWTGVLLNRYLSYPKILENKDVFFKKNS